MLDTYDVISTREFTAPATEVWRAWSDPVYLAQWWGPYGFTSPTADLDSRDGGTSLVCMRAPAEFGGQDMYNTWTYRRIEPISLIEFDNAFNDATGARIDPPPGVPLDVRHVVTFAPLPSGRTWMTVTEFGIPKSRCATNRRQVWSSAWTRWGRCWRSIDTDSGDRNDSDGESPCVRERCRVRSGATREIGREGPQR